MEKTKIQVVLCDLDGVVLQSCPPDERLWRLSLLFIPSDIWGKQAPEGAEALRSSFLAELGRQGVLDLSRSGNDVAWKIDTGVVSHRELYQAFLAASDLDEEDFPPEKFWTAYSADHLVFPPVCDLLKELHSRGINLIAASNCQIWTPDLVYLRTGLRFWGAVLSWQVGCKKPGELFFARCRELAREATGDQTLDYDACLLIDDKPSYGKAFRAFGGHAIQFKASENPQTLKHLVGKLRRELRGLGLLE